MYPEGRETAVLAPDGWVGSGDCQSLCHWFLIANSDNYYYAFEVSPPTLRDSNKLNDVTTIKRGCGSHPFGQVFLGCLSIGSVVKVSFWDLEGYCNFSIIAVFCLGMKQ